MVDQAVKRRRLPLYYPGMFASAGSFLYFYFICFTVFIMMQPFAMIISGVDPLHPEVSGNSSKLPLIMQLTSFLLLIPSFIKNFRKLPPLLWASIPYLAYMAVAWFLLNFAFDPKWSSYAFVERLFAVIMVFSLYLNLDSKNIIKALIFISVSVSVLSIFLVVTKPAFGTMMPIAGSIDSGAGHPWRGIFFQKNHLAHFCAISLPCLFFFGRPYFRSQIIWLFGCFTTFVCLILAKSAGGYLIAGILFMLSILVFRQRGLMRQVGIFIVIFTAVLGGLLKNAFALFVLKSLGKNETLTGRAQIWDYARSLLNENLLIGHGFNFTASPELSQDLLAHFNIVSVHNAYLDTLINEGIIGATLLVIAIIWALVAAWRLRLTGHSEVLRSMCTLMIIGSLVSGFSEALATQPIGPQAVMLLLGLFGLYRCSLAESHAPRRVRRRAAGWGGSPGKPQPRRRGAGLISNGSG